MLVIRLEPVSCLVKILLQFLRTLNVNVLELVICNKLLPFTNLFNPFLIKSVKGVQFNP